MKKLIYILILVLAPAALKADKIQRVDSLLRIFEKTQSIVIANQISSELMDEVDPTYSFSEKDKLEYVKGAIYTECSQYMYLCERYQDAIAYARKGLDCAESRKDEPMISECLSNLSLSYDELKAFDLSLKYALQSLEIDKKLGNKFDMSLSYNNLAIFYSNAGQNDKAVECIKKSLSISADFPLQKYSQKVAIYHNTAGIIYQEIGKLKEALDMYSRAEELAVLSNDKRHVYTYLRSVGACLLCLGRKEEAERRFNLIINELDGNISITQDNAGALFFCLKYFNRYDAALELAHREHLVDSLPSILVTMANHEKSPEKIKDYMNEALMWKDSVNMKMISKKNQLIASEIKSAEIEKEATKEKAEEISHNLKFTMIVIVCSLLAVIAAITFFGWLSDKKKLAISEHRLAKVTNRSEQLTNALSSLVRNILNDLLSASANISIITHMLNEKTPDDELITELSSQSDSLRSFLDNTIFWTRIQLAGKTHINKLRVSVNDMVDEIIMACQPSAERKEITLESKSDMKCVAELDRNVMSFIIRNIVNNAIKHLNQGEHICVLFNQSQISVVYTGKGLDPEIVKSLNSGIIPDNLKQNSDLDLDFTFICDLINMTDCKLEIESEENETIFRIIYVKI